jgi:spermidine synthase
LSFIGKQKLEQLDSILVLGVAGGSVIQTLRSDFKLNAKITGVEIDADVIHLANTYFQLNKTTN